MVSQEQTIVVLSASEWQDNPVSTMHVSSILSENHRVFFFETPGRRLPKLREFKRVFRRVKNLFVSSEKRAIRGLDPKNVEIISPFAIPLPRFRFIRFINHHLLVFQIKKLMRKHYVRSPIIWTFSPYWVGVINEIKKKCLVFQCVDALHTYDNSAYFQQAFKQIAGQADVVFTPGLLLYEELKKLNNNVHLIGHGCSDLHLNYKFIADPEKMANIPHPRVVYAGCLANWVDYDLLYETAIKLADYHFVLIGYVHGLTPQEKIEKLEQLSNVHFIGYINFDELPNYYHACDIGIIPYQADNEHIQYCTPTKILDYFAAGLPCISTRYPAAESLENLIEIIDDAMQFSTTIEETIVRETEGLKNERKIYAQSHSWNEQVKKMYTQVDACVEH